MQFLRNEFSKISDDLLSIGYWQSRDLQRIFQNAMEHSHLYENKIKWGDAFIIMFDVSDPKSFEEVTRIRYLISHYHTPEKLEFLKNKVKEKMHFEDKEQKLRTDCWFNPPVILIGNKNDCRTKDPSDSVTTYEAEQKAEELGKLSKIIFTIERNSFKLRFKPFFCR